MKLDYNLGDIVYLITDPEVQPRMVNRIQLSGTGLMYCCILGAEEESWHYNYELTSTRVLCEGL